MKWGLQCLSPISVSIAAAHPLRQRCELSLSLPTRGPVLKANGKLVNEDEERKIIFRFQKNFLRKALCRSVVSNV